MSQVITHLLLLTSTALPIESSVLRGKLRGKVRSRVMLQDLGFVHYDLNSTLDIVILFELTAFSNRIVNNWFSTPLDAKMEAIGSTALAVQFADVGGRALLGMIKLLKDLKETPKRMVELLQDVDKSVQRIGWLQNEIQQPASLFTQLSPTQIQRLTGRVDDAYQATVHLQHALEPLFRENDSGSHEWAKKPWRSVISIQMEMLRYRELTYLSY